MTVDGSQSTPIIVNTLNPLIYRSGTEEKPVQKIGLDYKAPLKKRSAGGASILWGECVRHPPDKKSLLSGFYLHPRSHFLYKLNLYSSLSLSRIPPAHISLSRTPARRASEKPCTAITHNFLATFTHRGAINLSNYAIKFLYRLVSGVFPGRSLTKTRTYRRATEPTWTDVVPKSRQDFGPKIADDHFGY